MTAGSGGSSTKENASGRSSGAHARLPLWAKSSAALQETPPRYQGTGEDIPSCHADDDGNAGAPGLRNILGKDPVRRRRGPPIPSISMCPCRRTRKTFPSKRRATRSPTYFAGSGKFLQRVRTFSKCRPSRSSWATTNLQRRPKTVRSCFSDRGEKSWWQAGDDASDFSARLGETSARARGLVRPHRDETRRSSPAGHRGARKGTFLKVK